MDQISYLRNDLGFIPDAIDNINLEDEFMPPEQNFGKLNNETIGLNNLTIGIENKIIGGGGNLTIGLDDTAGALIEGMNNPSAPPENVQQQPQPQPRKKSIEVQSFYEQEYATKNAAPKPKRNISQLQNEASDKKTCGDCVIF